MAISEVIKVRSLDASILYCCQYKKTDYGKYITTNGCSLVNAANEFRYVQAQKRASSSREFSVENWMIIQSFKPGEVTPEMAHEIGVKLAENYLGKGHQYIVTTHVDKGHIHNHIVFNATNRETMKQFDSRTQHYLVDLRNENDSLCRQYNLSVIDQQKGKGISLREYYARKHERSFKWKLAKLIDEAIAKSSTYEEFLEEMSKTCEIKRGKYVAFRQKDQTQFTRARKIGVDYTEESIKFRIEHKDVNIVKQADLQKQHYIDKSQGKFADLRNQGLRNWAANQNIAILAKEISEYGKNRKTMEQVIDGYEDLTRHVSNCITEIEELDKMLTDANKLFDAKAVYAKHYKMVMGYSKSSNKEEYKRQHALEFKEYDRAKYIVDDYKNKDIGKMTRDELKYHIDALKVQRDCTYVEYQSLKAEVANYRKENAYVIHEYESAIKEMLNKEKPQKREKSNDERDK